MKKNNNNCKIIRKSTTIDTNFNNNDDNDKENRTIISSSPHSEHVREACKISTSESTAQNANCSSNANNTNTKIVSNAIGKQQSEENTSNTVKQFSAPVDSFDEMNLREDLLRGIYAYGFEKPSLIQASAIVPIVSGRDTIAQAQSGTGKTATFSIAMLQKINRKKRVTQAIILAPTRELAEQSAKVCSDFAAPFMTDVEVQLLIGGRRVQECKTSLRRGPQIVSGTPGRVHHMIRDGYLKMKYVKMLCIDEADQMLEQGFKDQIYEIFQYVPEDCQIMLVSATMSPSVLKISERFMRQPFRILLQEDEVMLEGIRQFKISVENDHHKFAVLQDIYETLTIGASIVFVNTRRQADTLHAMMEEAGFATTKIHGEMPQAERDVALEDFRLGFSRVLISTDVLAKGIDVQGVSVVVNYHIPFDRAFYIHRIGRAGRFGRRGVAISLVTARDFTILQDIQRSCDCTIEDMPANISKMM